MVKLEKKIKAETNNPKMSKWKAAWEITKAVSEIGFYLGLMGAGGYAGYAIDSEIKSSGGNTDYLFTSLGAIVMGTLACYIQDVINGAFDDTPNDGSMQI
jgi:hypothetical protein